VEITIYVSPTLSISYNSSQKVSTLLVIIYIEIYLAYFFAYAILHNNLRVKFHLFWMYFAIFSDLIYFFK
jgi:hypothetical protein